MLGHWFIPPNSPDLFDELEFPPEQVRSKLFTAPAQHWSASVSPDQVARWMERLRTWAPSILQDAEDEEDGNTRRLELCDTLRCFDVLRQQLQPLPRPAQYPSHILISSVFLAFLLGSRKHMIEAVQLSMRVALPELDLEALLKHIQVPRTTTLARASTYLDFAFLQFCKRKWKSQQYTFYAWADSSPQSGREWFMLMHACVSSTDMLALFQAVNYLARSRPDFTDHHEAEEADIEEHIRCNMLVQATLYHHRCIPVAMGSGKTSLEDKAACLLHAMGLECDGLDSVAPHLRNVVSWTSDFGTEVQVPAFQSLDWKSLLPSWMHVKLPVDSDVCDGEHGGQLVVRPANAPEQEAATTSPQALMPNCLIVPGVLHIVHNLSKDLHENMSWWETFWEHLRAVAHLFATRHLRERFIATCVRGTVVAGREPEFMNAGIAPLYEKRWQATVLTIDNLFPIFESFCQAWDHSRFTSPGALPSGEAIAVTEAVSSNLFRRYVLMVHSVHKLVSGFESWLESCPCHHLVKTSGKRKAGPLSEQCQSAACPMRGKRACELAAGALEGLLDSLGQLASQSFAHTEAGAALSPEEHATLQQDFEYAKVFLNFGLKTKLKFWTTVPWRLCGLGHHWTSVARSVAKACLDEYNEVMQNTQVLDAHHHPLSVEFLSPAGPLREAVELFARGQEMGSELALAVARLKFVPCVERVVEGLHRDVKIASKHVQLGPTKVSLTVRLKEIKLQHGHSLENASELTQHFDGVRHLKQAAAMLGVLHHPSILELLFNQVIDTGTW